MTARKTDAAQSEVVGIHGLAARWAAELAGDLLVRDTDSEQGWTPCAALDDHELDSLLGWVHQEVSRVNADTPPLGFFEDSRRAVLLSHVSHVLRLSLEAAEKLCDAAGWPS